MPVLYTLTVFEVLTSVFTALLIIIILYYKWCFTYWKSRNIPPTRKPKIPFGTLIYPFLETPVHIAIAIKNAYDNLKKRSCKHGGGFLFLTPKYVLVDPGYIKNILQKDFEYFSERAFYYNEKDDPISANLFAISGEKWRTFRTHLSPAFTSGKMKMMFSNMLKCSNEMVNAVLKNENKKALDVIDITESFTIDVIGSCGFGIDCNSFKNSNAEFKEQGKKAFRMYPFRILKIFLGFYCPKIADFLGVTLFGRESNNFFIKIVKDTIKFREDNNVNRQDLLQLLIELRNQQILKSQEKVFTIKEITAQVFIFFAAGFETSSTTLSFCLYELALHEDIQNKLRDEINTVLNVHNRHLTYEAIMDMKYMGQVVDETLRKYPPVPYISRRCVKDYIIPNTVIKIDKGIEALIPIMALHHDSEYYPEPEKFIPERFSDEEKQKRLPFTYLPFGEGPRLCIGKRFGLLQTKVGLAVLLKHFKFSLHGKTKVPLQIEPFSFTLLAKSGIFLDVEDIIAK
ncbi:hypothetical protein ILUMI_24734 [Ignelater luminosus]|uniref:Cytochrome P450 n=1 Tax=Ignelater luminosus TaxID=2038154 RepID=A0A8K0CBC1_IGNLU|nr:hypothetical protein ILUMI_24734 [Ignelater luminosus]